MKSLINYLLLLCTVFSKHTINFPLKKMISSLGLSQKETSEYNFHKISIS